MFLPKSESSLESTLLTGAACLIALACSPGALGILQTFVYRWSHALNLLAMR